MSGLRADNNKEPSELPDLTGKSGGSESFVIVQPFISEMKGYSTIKI